jgi:hypothetical protein
VAPDERVVSRNNARRAPESHVDRLFAIPPFRSPPRTFRPLRLASYNWRISGTGEGGRGCLRADPLSAVAESIDPWRSLIVEGMRAGRPD